MPYRALKLTSLCLCFILCFQQSGLTQALTKLNLAASHLDYDDNLTNTFKLLLDKGDLGNALYL